MQLLLSSFWPPYQHWINALFFSPQFGHKSAFQISNQAVPICVISASESLCYQSAQSIFTLRFRGLAFFNYSILARPSIMEELLGLHEETAQCRPDRELGESWEEINRKMKRTLMATEQSNYPRRKLFSEAPSYSKSQPRKVVFREGSEEVGRSNRVALKLIRALTEEDCIESYRRSLSKRTNTDPSPKQSIQKPPKLRELKFNSPSVLNLKPQPVKSLQDNLKPRLSIRRMLQIRQNNAEQRINPTNKAIKKEVYANRMGKSHSETLCSQREMVLPAKVNILIDSEAESSLRILQKVSQSLILRRSLHLQESVKMRENYKDSLPYLSLGHHHQRKQDSVRSRNIHQHWPCLHRNLSKPHQLQDCKRARQRELQARLRRDLLELGKKGKMFANIRPTRLKLIK